MLNPFKDSYGVLKSCDDRRHDGSHCLASAFWESNSSLIFQILFHGTKNGSEKLQKVIGNYREMPFNVGSWDLDIEEAKAGGNPAFQEIIN